jgi:GTP-binding protein HflX
MGMENLLKAIEAALGHARHHVLLRLPYAMGGMVDTLHSSAKVNSVEYTGEGMEIDAVLDDILYGRLKNYVIKEL